MIKKYIVLFSLFILGVVFAVLGIILFSKGYMFYGFLCLLAAVAIQICIEPKDYKYNYEEELDKNEN